MCRKNTFTGIAYQDDWAIMGYDLFNEHRCPASQQGAGCQGRITNWINYMAAYAKSLNEKQLISVGEEGFYASQPGCNPTGVPGNVLPGWASRIGQGAPCTTPLPQLQSATVS